MTSSSVTRPPLVVICGPTASGKTALALELAATFRFEVVSADSRQVYRRMDIGTAKPEPDELQRLPHHLIDVVWPDEPFDASRFSELAAAAIDAIRARDRLPLLVGGTGLYIRALTQGLLEAPGADPELRRQLHARAEQEGSVALHEELRRVDPAAADRLHPNDLVRIVRALEVFAQSGRTLTAFQEEHRFADQPYRLLKVGLLPERSALFEQIDRRAVQMFDRGLVEETQGLLDAGYGAELKAMQTIGYRQAVRLIRGEMSLQEAIEDLQRATRRYAKQQITWFRQDKSIIWVDSSADFVKIRALIENFYACQRSGYGEVPV